MRLIVIFLPVLFFLGCKNAEKPRKIKVVPVDFVSLDHFSSSPGDESFFNGVSDLLVSDDYLYIADRENCRVLQWGKDLNLISQFGSCGSGPGESRGLLNLAVYEDQIFALSAMSRKIIRFSKAGDFISEIVPPQNVRGNFVVHDDILYLPNPGHQSGTISAYHLDNPNETFTFGEVFSTPSLQGKASHNDRHLGTVRFDGTDYLVAVGVSKPFIEVYDWTGKHLFSYDMSKNPVFSSGLKRQESEGYDPYSIIMLIRDIYTSGSSIYLAVFSGEGPVREFVHFEMTGAREIEWKGAVNFKHDDRFTIVAFERLNDQWILYDGVSESIVTTKVVE